MTVKDIIVEYGPNFITYAGYVNNVRVHFRSYDKLKRAEVVAKLKQRYTDLGYVD